MSENHELERLKLSRVGDKWHMSGEGVSWLSTDICPKERIVAIGETKQQAKERFFRLLVGPQVFVQNSKVFK